MAKEDEQKPGQQQPEGECKFNHKQYSLLKRCSDKKDMTEWNQWRDKHLGEEIWLQGANLERAYLENADLHNVHLENAKLQHANLENAKFVYAHLENAKLGDANLENVKLIGAHIEYAELHRAHLENAHLSFAHLENADFKYAHLKNAYIMHAHLENADLSEAHLENAYLEDANLENAYLRGTHMANANLSKANLKGASFFGAELQGVDFTTAVVNGETLIWICKVDNKTNFKGVGLDSARIEPEIKQLLEYNSRRMNWERWYIEHPKMKWLVKPFWEMSDYGISTKQIIVTFFKWAIVFAVIYYILGAFDYYLVGFKDNPGPIADLFVDEGGPISWCLVPLRSIYFSVVTMTTLGFGDMHANSHNPWWSGVGHVLLMIQVLLGYVLLGALVTRFAVLFTAGGPAGKFTPIKTKEKGEVEKNKA